MTIQLVVPNAEPKCPRGDRLQEEPSAKNAQGLFPPEACIFVGNLSTKVPTETLAEDLKSVFTQFGACHVKIKQDKKKGLPGAFVQFERVEDANAALANEESTVLHDRPLRIERAKGRRTACLGLRSLQPITAQDVVTALGGRGSLEVYTIEPQQTGIQTWTDVAKVTFAFVDDCRDAIKHFQKDDQYYLHLLDMDGSPLLQGSVQGPGYAPSRPKPYNGPFPRGGNFHPRNTNNRQNRNGNGNFNHRGGYRGGFSKPHHPSMNNETMPPHGGYIPNPSIMMTSMPFHNENHPPFYSPRPGPPPPPGPSGYGPPPIMFNGPAGYMGPHPPPEAFGPLANGPFIVGGMPSWSPPAPNFYPGPFVPDNGYISPQPGMNGPNAYFGPVGPMGYGEPWAGQSTFTPSPPHVNNHNSGHRKAPAPVKPRNVMTNDIPKAKVEDDQFPENDTVGGVPLNPKTPEKAPRLIRVYHDDEEEDDDLKAGSEKASTINGVVVSVQEITDDDSATEADFRSRSRSRSLSRDPCRSQSQSPSRSRSHSHSGSRSRSVSSSGIRLSSETDSAPPSDSVKSKKTKKTKRKKNVRWSKDTPMDETKPPSPSNSTISTASSCTCASPTQKPVDTLPDTKTGISIEEYVRREAYGRGLSEDDLQDVIQSLKAEQLLKNGHIPKEEQMDKANHQEKQALPAGTDDQLVSGTDSRGSQNGSVARKRSLKRSVKAA